MTHLEVASNLKFIREQSSQNDGPWVEAILSIVGLKKGNPWCSAFVSFCLMIAFAGKGPLPVTASCDVLLEFAKKNNLIHESPLPGDVFLVMKTPTDAHHTGFVSRVDSVAFSTIEGNTNPAGGREGYGVFARKRINAPGKYLFIRVIAA